LEIFGSSLGWLGRALINLELAWARRSYDTEEG
jgi:hypothetical protein